MTRAHSERLCGSNVLLGVVLLVAFSGCSDVSSPTSDDQPVLTGDELLRMIDDALEFTRDQRTLNSRQHAAWQILHGVLAYGRDFTMDHNETRVQALEWVLGGGDLSGWRVRKGDVGLKAVLEAGTKTGQGHEDQWLAVISQAGLGLDHPIRVGDEQYTVGDLVNQAKYDVYEGKECSWTLIGLSGYLSLGASWTAGDGTDWSLERIIKMEADQELTVSACGGSHRLIGMTMALRRYQEAHGDDPLTGGWAAAEEKIAWAIETTQRFQQPSGAFSVNYFQRSADTPDLAARLGATGHTLEFLALAVDDETLRSPWVTRGVRHLCRLFQQTRQIDLECGALYHAAHGLALYRERRFGRRPVAAVELTNEEVNPSDASQAFKSRQRSPFVVSLNSLGPPFHSSSAPFVVSSVGSSSVAPFASAGGESRFADRST